MSNSEDSYDKEDYVSISTRFGSGVRPRLDTQQMNALQESVRKQKLEREKINKEGDKLSVLQGYICKTNKKENDDESFTSEKDDEQKISSDKSQESDESRDHIVPISHAWIFDSNLDFALPLNKERLDWCCGFRQDGTTFESCWEMASFSQCFIGKYFIKAMLCMKK